jgi:hypothetical protein
MGPLQDWRHRQETVMLAFSIPFRHHDAASMSAVAPQATWQQDWMQRLAAMGEAYGAHL